MPDETEVVEELRRSSLFAGASDARLRALAATAFVRRLRDGQILFTVGEPSDHLFQVRSGRVRILVSSPDGGELTLSVRSAGETVGELSVIDARPRSAAAEAIGETALLAVPAAAVRTLLEHEPAVLMAAATGLATRVRRLTGSTSDLVFLDLPRRLAKLLLAEALPGPDGRLRVRPGMSQSGLAARLGVTRQTLNRALGSLVRHGWLETHGAEFTLADPEALRRFAGS